jgi:hypothetical protein
MAIRLNYLCLVASFAVGLAVMMLTIPKPKVVVKFPSPETADEYTYRGAGGTCFKIAAENEECPADGKNVRSQPVSTDEDSTQDGWGLAGMFDPASRPT